MKKLFGNLYIFSKFAFSFTLLICLLGALYLIFINYQKERNNSDKQISYDEKLKNEINKNLNLINDINNEIKQNKTALLKIEKRIELMLNQNNNEELSQVVESVKLLNKKFDILSGDIDTLKNKKSDLLSKTNKGDKDIIYNAKNDVLDLILFKYENNIVFDEELKYLKKILTESEFSNFEKITVLSKNPFKGYQFIKETFDNEVNIHLKKTIDKNPNSLFSKLILPYLEISPTSENNLDNDLIIKIKATKLNIENRNLDKSLKNLETINNYENIFKLSTIEIKKYINFKNQLIKLK